MKLKKILFSLLVLVLFSSCEDKNIDGEVARLQGLERELITDISNKKVEHATLLCIQMKWQYVATTAGAAGKCKRHAEIWDEKRRNYLKIMGLNPTEILEAKPKPKSLQERFLYGD